MALNQIEIMEDHKQSESFHFQKAKNKVKAIKEFYCNLLCYCIVIPILITINLIYMSTFHWFWFSMLGWGSGIVLHGIEAFGYNPLMPKNWEQRKLKQFLEEEEEKEKHLG